MFSRTIESLVAQTDKGFSVLISDNFSTSGQEHITRALSALTAAGIAARRIQPPAEVGRVEHWNWLHYQSTADWLKPLFAGDWLEPDYVRMVREVFAKEPGCGYFFCNYQHHHGAEVSAGAFTLAGGPVVVTARGAGDRDALRDAIRAAQRGGVPAGPVSSFRWLRSESAHLCGQPVFLQAGCPPRRVRDFPRRGTHFFIHAARFSDQLPGKQRETRRETFRYYAELGAAAWHEGWRFPKLGYLRLFVREWLHRNKVR